MSELEQLDEQIQELEEISRRISLLMLQLLTRRRELAPPRVYLSVKADV